VKVNDKYKQNITLDTLDHNLN